MFIINKSKDTIGEDVQESDCVWGKMEKWQWEQQTRKLKKVWLDIKFLCSLLILRWYPRLVSWVCEDVQALFVPFQHCVREISDNVDFSSSYSCCSIEKIFFTAQHREAAQGKSEKRVWEEEREEEWKSLGNVTNTLAMMLRNTSVKNTKFIRTEDNFPFSCEIFHLTFSELTSALMLNVVSRMRITWSELDS